MTHFALMLSVVGMPKLVDAEIIDADGVVLVVVWSVKVLLFEHPLELPKLPLLYI